MYGHIVRWSFKWSLMPINYWMLPGLARVSRMPRIAAEVEGMHPSSLEGLALHQRHSYKWSQWCRSLLGRLLCGTRGKWRSSQTIFQQPVTWRFQTTLPGFQKESHILTQIMTKENDFWAYNTHELCHTVCKTWSTGRQEKWRGCHEAAPGKR